MYFCCLFDTNIYIMKDLTIINVPESRFLALESKIALLLEKVNDAKEVQNKTLYTPNEFCEVLKISRSTFNRMKEKGMMKFTTMGGRKMFIHADEVERLIKEGC